MPMNDSTLDRAAVNGELVDRFARKEATVAKWSDAIAATVLASLRRDERIAASRAAAHAGEPLQEHPAVTPFERAAAADALAEVLRDGDTHAVANTVSFAVYMLPNPFLRKLADRMAAVLKGEAPHGGG